MTGSTTPAGTPPRILILWAAEASVNLGVAALARGSRDLLRRAHPDAEFVYADYGSRPREIPFGLPRSLLRERVQGRFGMQEYLAGFDLAWDTRSGDSFADIYGVPRHLTMSLVHEFTVEAGTPVVMAPQTIGPFATRRGRALARRTLRRSALVIARDPRSAEAATELGRAPDLTAADLVFAIDPPEPGPDRDVLVNVSGLLWTENPHVDAAGYRRAIRETVQGLRAEGREVALLAHVLESDNPDNDVPAVRALREELGEDLEIIVPTDLDSVRGAIAGANLVIASRMHACLNALSVGVPTIPLAYSRKFAPLLGSVGWETGFDLRHDDLFSLPPRVLAAASQVRREDAEAAAARGCASLEAVLELVRTLR
ncbi:polysaccharide pyruvyl transferase family protein [Brachybacterium squillarum]|uniref:polysaccharide pyruvyl transferase family protein n=1 Tax=Brachybacterium squillarum TaxID=661979 RepID=UPI0002629625|nr:polysaccharide pyruvyl transferase family protein [Brachybacterium squillarum]